MLRESVTSTDVPAALVEWSSKRIHRVVRSTLAAEGGALSNAHDRSDFARVIFAEMMGKLELDLSQGRIADLFNAFDDNGNNGSRRSARRTTSRLEIRI